MHIKDNDCLFTEGKVTLPAGYQDRTVNVITPAQQGAAALNISRDSLNENESLAAYIDRQLALLAQHLKGWKQAAREPAELGDKHLVGECVHASYLRDGKRVWQQQAVFNTQENHILVFTITKAAALDAADIQLFGQLLASFTGHGSQ